MDTRILVLAALSMAMVVWYAWSKRLPVAALENGALAEYDAHALKARYHQVLALVRELPRTPRQRELLDGLSEAQTRLEVGSLFSRWTIAMPDQALLAQAEVLLGLISRDALAEQQAETELHERRSQIKAKLVQLTEYRETLRTTPLSIRPELLGGMCASVQVRAKALLSGYACPTASLRQHLRCLEQDLEYVLRSLATLIARRDALLDLLGQPALAALPGWYLLVGRVPHTNPQRAVVQAAAETLLARRRMLPELAANRPIVLSDTTLLDLLDEARAIQCEAALLEQRVFLLCA